MHYILLLMLFGNGALATTTNPVTEDLDIPLCKAIDTELRSAVELDIITEQQAALISVRCWTYHS